MTPLRAFVFAVCFVCPFVTAVAQDRRGPFTHAPRSVRSRDVDQQHLRLELRVDLDKEELKGRSILKVAPYKPLSSLTLDAADMQIQRVVLVHQAPQQGERELKFERRGGSLAITLDREYKTDEAFTVAVDYRVSKPEFGAHFVTPDASEPDQPRMMWTQSEPEFARFWYPCIDSSADRLTSEVVVTAAKPLFVLSNGTLKSKTENPDGTQTYHWVQEKSHVTYLMSVVVGDFEAFEQSWDGIPIVSYVPRGRLADAARSFEKTPGMMKFFSQKIGYRYPWPKYAQICVDEYEWGGMEHTSATTLNHRTLHDERAHLDTDSDNLIAHELAHQWWGDLLTCKDWGELWLNESFATYFATLWQEQDEGWNEATWARAQEARDYMEEDKTIRRAIVNYRYDTPEHMFDRHSYPKGGRVLHMLRFELGDDWFWKSLHRYVSVNQFRTVETADLRIAIDEATGQGMNWFFDQWLQHGGHPEFAVDWHWDEASKTARVTVKQTQKVDEVTPLFRTSVEIELASPQATVMRRVQITKAEETFHFQLEQRPSRVCFDPKDWILKKLAFEKSKDELLDQLAHDSHVIARAQAAQGLAKFSEGEEEDTVAALLRAANTDGFWGVRQEAVKVLGKLHSDEVRAALVGIAAKDAKSQVRREALIALGNFAHDDARAALRAAIKNDRSYNAVAEALKSLLKVDRDHCAADLVAALDVPSHNEVIDKAACDGLVELKSAKAQERLATLLSQKQTPERRAIFLAALARLAPDEPKYLAQLKEQLGNDRRDIRRATIDALVDLGHPQAIHWLQERRGKEVMPSSIRAVDAAIEKLRGKERNLDQLRKEIEQLRSQNQRLEERLKKLEKAANESSDQ